MTPAALLGARPRRLLPFAFAVFAMMSCRTPATQIQLFIDTDAPADRSLNLDVYAFQGLVNPTDLPTRAQMHMGAIGHVALSRNELGRGTFVAGGSLGIVPAAMGDRDSVTLWVTAAIAPTATSPAISLERAARVSFVRGRSGTARLFLRIACGDQALGCTSVSANDCTVGVRCREQNAACGDQGECVAPELPVTLPAEDGAVQDSGMVSAVDASVQRADAANSQTDASVMDGADPDAAASDVSTMSDINDGGCAPMGEVIGGRCVPFVGAPTQSRPGSLMDVTILRPSLRWTLTGSYTGAVVELCRDRACTNVIETLRVTGATAVPTAALPARSVVYWRLRGRIGADESARVSATWLFHTPAREAMGGTDGNFHAHNDVNGDGVDDIILGSRYGVPAGGVNTGTATIIHGGASLLAARPARDLAGIAAADEFGFSVAGAGDLNGDGYGDVAISAPAAASGGRMQTGTVSVYYGSSTGIAPAPGHVLAGTAALEGFGTAVASAGDVNADGFGDLVVGSVFAAPMGRTTAGTASVFLGSAAGVQTTPATVLFGAMGDQMGISVSALGDLDGDGFGELLVGSYSASPGVRMNAGIAAIYQGFAGGVRPLAARTFEGALAGDRFGTGAGFVGDLNADGRPDFAIGAYQALAGALPNAGDAMVYYGADRIENIAAPTRLSLLMQGAGFGRCVTSAGDVDNDGYGDLAVGAYGATVSGRPAVGGVAIYRGSAMGVSNILSPIVGGLAMGELFGYAVVGGDFNNDGYSDVIVGSHMADPQGRMDAGLVRVFLGSMSGLQTMAAQTLEGQTPFALFGYSVASLSWGERWEGVLFQRRNRRWWLTQSDAQRAL